MRNDHCLCKVLHDAEAKGSVLDTGGLVTLPTFHKMASKCIVVIKQMPRHAAAVVIKQMLHHVEVTITTLNASSGSRWRRNPSRRSQIASGTAQLTNTMHGISTCCRMGTAGVAMRTSDFTQLVAGRAAWRHASAWHLRRRHGRGHHSKWHDLAQSCSCMQPLQATHLLEGSAVPPELDGAAEGDRGQHGVEHHIQRQLRHREVVPVRGLHPAVGERQQQRHRVHGPDCGLLLFLSPGRSGPIG